MHIGLVNLGRAVNFAIGATIEVTEWVIVAFSVACSSKREWKASQHSEYRCVVIPHTSEDGLLSPGIQSASLNDFAGSFGHTDHRRKLLDGLRATMMNLKNAGCQTTYVNGSFAIGKEVPGDFGDCWEEAGDQSYNP